MRSLYGKLAAVLLALLTLFAAVCLYSLVTTAWSYAQAAQQRLHRDLAAQLVDENILMLDGKIQQRELDGVFHTLMVINPSIEVYLLDGAGTILAYSAPAGKVQRRSVSLAPIDTFLAGAELPVFGDDPRGLERRKIFSAAPIPGKAGQEGYLYIILAGEELETVFERVAESGILRLSLLWLGLLLAVVVVAGLVLFHLLTRRLRRLATAMQAFEASGFRTPPDAEGAGTTGGDEIDRLSATFRGMARRIVEQIGELRRADALRRELVAHVSHDLRTPLTHIQGYLETLLLQEESVPTAERRRYLEIAVRHSERLGKLVADLFDLATLDAGAHELRCEVFSLTELAQDVGQKFRLAAEERGLRLRVELPEDLAGVYADLGLVERALDNLLENALRYTPAGGEIWLEVERHEDEVTVRVNDNGPGIPPGEIPRIFGRFYRQPLDGAGVTGESPGVGLGLAIARRVVELHGATLGCRSDPGRRTSFFFTLRAAELRDRNVMVS